MPGSADPVDVWLLLEYRSAWRAKAVIDNDLTAEMRAWFAGMPEFIDALGLKARAQLVRQPEINATEIRLMIALNDALFEFASPTYQGLMEVDVADVVARPERWLSARIDEPRYFVCTNGQRDLCCARFGLPVYQALRSRLGPRVWQTTHLGGHRFAPNVLVLPQSALYGRVSEECLDDLLSDTEAGALHGPLLRGRHGYAAPAQAAEAYLLKHFGDSWSLRDVDEMQQGWDVSFVSGADTAWLRVVQREEPEMILKSCADDQAKPVRPYLIDSCSINGSMEDQPAT